MPLADGNKHALKVVPVSVHENIIPLIGNMIELHSF